MGVFSVSTETQQQVFSAQMSCHKTFRTAVQITPYYTGCPRRNVPDFGRVFLMLRYTDITQNTYYPRLNGYGDNGQRKVGASCGSKYCNLHS